MVDATELGTSLEPHRAEIRAHCYRFLGSLADAEDATQDTMLRALRGAETLESIATVRPWLYRIATNVCLDRLARPAPLTETHGPDPAPASVWEDVALGPEATITLRESVTLAFLTALHSLPPLQRAVLLLRDVMGWSADEVAGLLDQSVASVNSALQRARGQLPARAPARMEPDAATRALLSRYVHAWESRDAPALTSLLREDAMFTMPPQPALIGPQQVLALLSGLFARLGGEMRVIEVSVFGGLGVAAYHRPAGETSFHAHAIQAIEIADGQIAVTHTYLNAALFPSFGLPSTLD